MYHFLWLNINWHWFTLNLQSKINRLIEQKEDFRVCVLFYNVMATVCLALKKKNIWASKHDFGTHRICANASNKPHAVV